MTREEKIIERLEQLSKRIAKLSAETEKIKKLAKRLKESQRLPYKKIEGTKPWEEVLATRVVEASDFHEFPDGVPQDIVESVDYALTTIRARESEALRMRYRDGMTLEQIGKRLEVSGERARQIINNGEWFLRHPTRIAYIAYGLTRASIIQTELRDEMEKARQGGLSALEFHADTPIDSLSLTTRASNALHRAEIETVGDIVKLMDKLDCDIYEALFSIRYCGHKTAVQILASLKDAAGITDEEMTALCKKRKKETV